MPSVTVARLPDSLPILEILPESGVQQGFQKRRVLGLA